MSGRPPRGGPFDFPWMTPEIMASMLDPDRPTSDQLTSHHEAGHAVAAVALGIEINHVSVVEGRHNLGAVIFAQKPPHLRTGFDPANPDDRQTAEDWILMAFAGEAADADHAGRDFNIHSPGARADFLCALEIAHRLHADRDGRDALFAEMCRRASQFVREPLRESQISLVAWHLRMARELGRQEVVALMDKMASADWPEDPDEGTRARE